MRGDRFCSDLWFMVESDSQLVGVALCMGSPDAGWVGQLAVAESWRRRGLASALLRHAFGVFFRAGKPIVGLQLLANNERALRLYENVGMRKVRQIDDYETALLPD